MRVLADLEGCCQCLERCFKEVMRRFQITFALKQVLADSFQLKSRHYC